jgi:carboxymethylenebutenolidase
MARPRQTGRKGFVIVVHENRGLNAHIRDVTRRVALGGFVAFAPDYLTPLGGTPDNPDTARDMFARLPAEAVIEITRKLVTYGNAHPEASGKTGIVGFCWGGGVVNRAAVTLPELAAGVVYYGVAPDVSKTGDIKAALMVHLAGLDERVNNTYPPYEAALKAAGKNAVVHRYDGVNHAFNNDTSAERFNKAAADQAWERTLAFLAKELAGPRTTG